MQKTNFHVCILFAFIVTAVRAAETQLRYDIETLNGARTAELVSPGADGSEFALKLTNDSSMWSRFNWPMFRPLSKVGPSPKVKKSRSGFQPDSPVGNRTCAAHSGDSRCGGGAGSFLEFLCVSVKREGSLPHTVQIRLLTTDGVEWQSKHLEVTEEWQRFTLSAESFSIFRGADKKVRHHLSFNRVVQFQVLPMTVKSGGLGCLYVDNLGFESTERFFTHEKSEQRDAASDERGIILERINDLRARWSSDVKNLTAAEFGVKYQNEVLAAVVKEMQEGKLQQAKTLLVKSHVLWNSTRLEPVFNSTDYFPVLSKGDYQRKLAGLKQDVESALIAHNTSDKRYTQTLYQTVKQNPSERIEDGSSVFLRQQVDFSKKEGRQVVFLTMNLPGDPVDVRNRIIRVPMRCTAKQLNDRKPMLLRLYSQPLSGGESWAQFASQPFPCKEWTECVFDLSRPVDNAHFSPERVIKASLRIENCIGVTDEFLVEMGPLSLGWPPADQRLFNQEVAGIEQGVKNARLSLLRQRERHAQLETLLQDDPEINRLYWQGFESPACRRGSLPEKGGKPELVTDADSAVTIGEIRVRSDISVEKASLIVSHEFGATSHVRVRVIDAQGYLVAECDSVGSQIEVPVPQAKLWHPGNSYLYHVSVDVRRDNELVGSLFRKIGMRKSAVRPSGTSTVLRHAVNKGWPDWSMTWNNQGSFGRYACYSLPREQERDSDVRNLLDQLWVDGVRLYGFASRPANLARDDQFGIGTLASVAPSYRGLTGWGELKQFGKETSLRYELLNGWGDSASVAVLQVGNEVELSEWGADLTSAFPGAPYQPLDMVAEIAKKNEVTQAPVMYVRAGRYSTIPPLPHEDICGINQYTGRYSGRMDEIERDLAELSVQSLFANRPLMITEWNGPKYSWAGSGIGGVTQRGAAYYLERYWRGLIDTPAVVGSSEFTLNWVIAPFEDLTNQSREDAWKNRPPHSRFSSLNPADHVPLIGPESVKPNECMQSMKAFHGPFYVMMQRPGSIAVVSGKDTEQAAARLTTAFEKLGKKVNRIKESSFDLSQSAVADSHIVALLSVKSEIRNRLEQEGVIESAAPGRTTPLVQTRVNPQSPLRLLTVLTARSDAALQEGCDQLCESVEALADLRMQESKMERVLAVTDKKLLRVYERYLLDQVGRGYIVTGDDVCTSLSDVNLFSPDGGRWQSWSDMTALILDCRRKLSADELRIAEQLCGEGVNLVVSRACYEKNPELKDWLRAELKERVALSKQMDLTPPVSTPVEVKQFGGIDLVPIEHFGGVKADSKVLNASVIAGDGEPLVTTADGKPVVMSWQRGKGRVVLFGCDFGDVALVHNKVTRSGEKHRLYDRDTACGLERVARCVVNACLNQDADDVIRPRLYLRTAPESVVVKGGTKAVARMTVQLCDFKGLPVDGELLGRARMRVDGVGSDHSGFTRLKKTGPGKFQIQCAPDQIADGQTLYYRPASRLGVRWTTIGVQLKAYADGYVPTDGGAAFIVDE